MKPPIILSTHSTLISPKPVGEVDGFDQKAAELISAAKFVHQAIVYFVWNSCMNFIQLSALPLNRPLRKWRNAKGQLVYFPINLNGFQI